MDYKCWAFALALTDAEILRVEKERSNTKAKFAWLIMTCLCNKNVIYANHMITIFFVVNRIYLLFIGNSQEIA